jgi:hypothetical protein
MPPITGHAPAKTMNAFQLHLALAVQEAQQKGFHGYANALSRILQLDLAKGKHS